MIIIGLTGSIGMGKTTAANIFRHFKIPVFDSDHCIRLVTSKRGEAVRDVVNHFPDAWNISKRILDRKILSDLVFGNEKERKRLESILHPFVWARQQKFLDHMRRLSMPMVVMDIPLLFETGADKRVDLTLVVSAPPYIQYQRVMARPGMTDEKFTQILASQMPDHEKRQRADIVVHTGLGRSHTTRQIKKIIANCA